MKLATLFSAIVLGTLTGCSTYHAKQAFQDEMLRLCKVDGGTHIYRTVQLDPKHFKNGEVEFDLPAAELFKGGARTVGDGRYEVTTRGTYLKHLPEHHLSLRKLETTIRDRATGEVVAESRRYCRDGGDSLSLNNTVECCPGFRSAIPLVFTKER